MAKAKALPPGRRVQITSGEYMGHVATIVDNRPIPDRDEHGNRNQDARKILVSIDDVHNEDDQPYEVWMLPRCIDNIVDDEMRAALTIVDGDHVVQYDPITDPMDPIYDPFRPNEAVVDKYISRIVPGGYNDIDFFLGLRDQRDDQGYSPNVGFVGETQSGKTMLVRVLAVLAARRDGMPKPYPIFTLNGANGITSYDIFGMTTAVLINGKETLVWMEGMAGLAAVCDGCILYLNEWNAVSAGQGIAIHSMLDDVRQFTNYQKAVPDGHGGFRPEIVTMSKNTWCVLTINPDTYKGTQTMAEASSNRISWYQWNYDEETEKRLVPSKTVRLIGAKLRDAHTKNLIAMPIGTSALQRLGRDCSVFGVDTAMWSFLSMFSDVDKKRIDTLLGDGTGLLDVLHSEFPEPTFQRAPAEEEEDLPVPGVTWDPNAIAIQRARRNLP